MRSFKPTHRRVSEQQALVLSKAIDNYRQIKKLRKAWEENTEGIVDALQPPRP